MKGPSVKEWLRGHLALTLTLLFAFVTMVAAILTVPGAPKFFPSDSAAQSESTQATSSSGRYAAPHPIEQPTQPSAVPTKGPTWAAPEPKPKKIEPVPKLSILYPKHDNDPVGRTSKVSIEYKNIPLSQYLWLIVETPEGGSWPHGRCVEQNPSETGPSLIERKGTTNVWETSPVQEISFGKVNDPRSKESHYTIHLVAVDQEVNERLMGVVREKCPKFEGQGTFENIRGFAEAKRIVLRTY